MRRLEEQLAALDRSRVTYIAQLRAVIERQLAELRARRADAVAPAPARRRSGRAAPAPRGADGRRRARHVKTPAWLESLVKE